MYEIQEEQGHQATATSQCVYCSARLNSFFYFCLGCGTPYKRIESLLPISRPRPLTDSELIELKAPGVAPLFWSYFSVVVGCALFSLLAFRQNRPELELFLTDAAIFIVTCIFASVYWRSLSVQFRQVGFDQLAAYVGLVLIAGALVVNWSYHSMWTHAWGLHDMPTWERLRADGLSEGLLVFSFCIVPAVTEEIGFRGLLQHWLQTAITPFHALVFASFLFTILHFSLASFPIIFGVGMILGWVKAKTNSLYPSMLMHFFHNFVVINYF